MAPTPSLLVVAASFAAAPGAVASAGCIGASAGTCHGSPTQESLLLQKTQHVAKAASELELNEEDGEIVDPMLPAPFLGDPGNSSERDASFAAFGASLAQLVGAAGSQERPSSLELEHFQLLKDLRKRGFKCPSKSFPGIPDTEATFQFDCRLWRAARLWSARMGRENFFSHVRGSSNPCTRTSEQGLPACGENIAAGNADPAKTLAQFKKSDGHCLNMMNPSYNRFAVGYVATAGSQWTNYWTQAMGSDNQPPDQSCLSQPAQPQRRRQVQKPPSGKCEDKDRYCATSYKQYCGTENIKETCPKTCGVCKAEQPKQPERRRSQQPQRPERRRQVQKPQLGKCEDKDRFCATSYKQYCGTENIKETCPKTCGVCKAEKPQGPKPGTCVDKDRYCATSYKQYCGNDNIAKTCPKTCGLC